MIKLVAVTLALSVLLSGCTSQSTDQSIATFTANQRKAVQEWKTYTDAKAVPKGGGQWNYQASTDEMSSGIVRQAVVKSLNEVEFGFPYEGPQRATLQLRKHPRWGKDVILSIERGQFLCHRDDCPVMIRYDDGTTYEYLGLEPADHNSTVIFIQGYADIVSTLKKSKRLRIETRVFQQRSPVFEFDTSNLQW